MRWSDAASRPSSVGRSPSALSNPPASPLSRTPMMVLKAAAWGGRTGSARSGAGITELVGALRVAARFSDSALADHGFALHGFALHGFADHGLALHGFALHGLADHGFAAITPASAGCGGQPQQSTSFAKYTMSSCAL